MINRSVSTPGHNRPTPARFWARRIIWATIAGITVYIWCVGFVAVLATWTV